MLTLVTGATGFVGSALVRQLVEQGDKVAILRRSSSQMDLLGPLAGQVEIRTGDVTDPEHLATAFVDVKQVYHTAAFVGFGGRRDQKQLYKVNVTGTAHVVDAALAAGVERLVHTSSMAALGRSFPPPSEPIDEKTTWATSPANTAYAHSKYLAELEIQRGIAEGLDAVIVNPALVFGVGRQDQNTMQIVSKVQRGKLPASPGGGTCVVDVRDVADGHLRAMKQGQTGHRYLLAGENLSWSSILTTLAEAMKVAPPKFTLPLPLAMTLATLSETASTLFRIRPLITRETARISGHTYRYNNHKAIDELGCTFRPFEETATWIAEALST